ncbi:glycosyltransferase [Rhodoluna lacicola]|uniref:glycosyltransferase n=1 Tax=Rhodoluna lacicola TaxID=529884 RepID=UPI00223122D2|nr:glycosyltransferase [Rhodoluna lacicola]BDS49758.1 hypothetical protein RKACHI23_00200 [Rhodoluna lacicola]
MSSLRLAIIGHVTAASGVGETSRRLGSMLEEIGVEVSYFTAPMSRAKRKASNLAEHKNFDSKDFDACLLVVNPDLLPITLALFGLLFDSGIYKIGFWSWEFEDAPKIWKTLAGLVDEVWTNSDFSALAISKVLPGTNVSCVPMKPQSALLSKNPTQGDSHLFTFYTSFDFQSDVDRKNPFAVIEAYRQAFGRSSNSTRLVIKSINGKRHKKSLDRLNELISKDKSIELIDSHLSVEENFELLNSADVFVSLHRAEGFGLNIYDSMTMGKRTITTGYSGNMQFQDQNTSNLVEFKRVPFRKIYSTYKISSFWAEPSIEDAANRMRKVFQEVGSDPKSLIGIAKAVSDKYSKDLVEFSNRLGLIEELKFKKTLKLNLRDLIQSISKSFVLAIWVFFPILGALRRRTSLLLDNAGLRK